jgi:hypothetical protein
MNPVIPGYITLIVVATNVAIAIAVWSVLTRSARESGLPLAAQRQVSIGSASFLGAWLAAAFFVAPRLGSLVGQGVSPVPPVIFLAAIAAGLVVVAIAFSPAFRRTLTAAPLPTIIGVQVYRLIGAVFVVLLGLGLLPAHFARPAGWGDVAVGLTAPLVALALLRGASGSRTLAAAWNLFGLLDLVVAVGMGSGLLVPLLVPGHGTATPAAALQQFPLVLIPAFAVPVSVLLHLLALNGLWHRARVSSGVMAPAR